MSVNLEKTSIILEVISFFLITIDLFGKKRIGLLQSRFENLMSVSKNVNWREGYTFLMADESADNLGCWSGCFLFFIVFFVIIAGSWFAWIFILGFLLSFLKRLSGELFACLVFLLSIKLAQFTAPYLIEFFMFLVRKSGYILVAILEKAVNGVFAIVLSLFNRLKLEGLMLIIGALLFVFSKVLAYINVGYK